MYDRSDDYLINLPDIPLTSAEAAQYKIDCAPSTGYLKKIKPMIFHQNWENKEVFRKKLVWVRPGNAIFIVTLLKNILKLSRCDFDYIAALKVSTWNSPIFSLELISFRQGINWIVNSNAKLFKLFIKTKKNTWIHQLWIKIGDDTSNFEYGFEYC